MKIGKTIKDLRRKKNMTQEMLAERLNVSVSAVSQWEMEKTMPDISMLPLLSVVFNVTTDELLGLKGDELEQKVNNFLNKADEYYRKDEWENAILVIREAYDEFPTHITIIERYAFYLKEHIGRFGITDSSFVDKCIELNEYVLDNSFDDVKRQNAISRMCICYSSKNDKDTALKYAFQLAKNFKSCAPYVIMRDKLLPDEKKSENYRGQIASLVQILDEFILALAHTPTLSIKERIDVLKQRISILDSVFSDKKLDKNYEIYDTHRIIGLLYVDCGDNELAMNHLEWAYDYALRFKNDYLKDDCYSSPVLFGYASSYGRGYKTNPNSALEDFKKRIVTHGFYKPLENNQRFCALKEKLQADI